MPTSITAAPGLIISPVTNSGLPIAAIRISASRVYFAISGVPEWTTVTVAFAPFAFCISIAASGLPTMLERPITTACLPAGSMPDFSSSTSTP